MTIPNDPIPGDDASEFLTSSPMWKSILEVVRAYNAGEFGKAPSGRDARTVVPGFDSGDAGGNDIPWGTLVPLYGLKEAPQGSSQSIKSSTYLKPTFKPDSADADFDWPGVLKNAAVTHQGQISYGVKPIRTARYIPVFVTVTKNTDQWVMPDPTDVKTFLTSDAGIYRIIALFEATDTEKDVAVIDTQEEQPVWKFETTGPYADNADGISVAPAKLLRLDGDVFADTGSEIEVTDYFGTGTTEGMCLHSAGKFIVSAGGSAGKIFMTGPQGIPAMAGLTPGIRVDSKLYSFDGTVLTDTGTTETVFNMMSSPIAKNTFIQTKTVGGGNFVDAEDCPAAVSTTNP